MLPMVKSHEFLNEVLSAVTEMTETDVTEADVNKSFVDLGVDSLMALELVVRLERQFQLVLSETEIKSLRTMSELVNIARAKAVI